MFNLRDDLSEKTDLAAKEPDRTKAMHEKLEVWRREVQAAMPSPNPDYHAKPAKLKPKK